MLIRGLICRLVSNIFYVSLKILAILALTGQWLGIEFKAFMMEMTGLSLTEKIIFNAYLM